MRLDRDEGLDVGVRVDVQHPAGGRPTDADQGAVHLAEVLQRHGDRLGDRLRFGQVPGHRHRAGCVLLRVLVQLVGHLCQHVGAARGTEIELVPLATAVSRLKTVTPHRLAETLAFTG